MPTTDEQRTLADAAALLGCNVETLRRRIRTGRLRATRGPHGAYVVHAVDLEGLWIRPATGGRLRRSEDESWSELERLIFNYRRTRADSLDLVHELQLLDPAASPVRRLIEVVRLRLAGQTYSQIAEALSISERHARRLGHRDPEVALRRELGRRRRHDELEAASSAAQVVARLEERLQRHGYKGPTRSDYLSAWPRARRLHRQLTPDEIDRLRSNGLTEEEISAMQTAGLTPDALSYLFGTDLPTYEPMGHESHLLAGAR